MESNKDRKQRLLCLFLIAFFLSQKQHSARSETFSSHLSVFSASTLLASVFFMNPPICYFVLFMYLFFLIEAFS